MLSLALILAITIAAACAPLLPAVYRFARRGELAAAGVGLAVLGGVWLLSTIILARLAAAGIYQIAMYYFATTLGTVPGLTQLEAGQRAGSVVAELWARQLLGARPLTACLTGDARVCQLADAASTVGTSFQIHLVAGAPALIAMFGALLVVRLRARRAAARAGAG